MSPSPPRPSIPSALHRATRQLQLHLDRIAGEHGLDGAEAHLIAYLGRYAPARVGELVRVFGLKASTVTSMLDRLEQRGLVRRAANPDDRRSFLVSLSARGRRLAAKGVATAAEFDAAVERVVSPTDRDAFFRVLAAIDQLTGQVVRPPSPPARRR